MSEYNPVPMKSAGKTQFKFKGPPTRLKATPYPDWDWTPPLTWRNEPPSEEEFEQGLWLLRKHVGEKPEILPSWQYGLSLKVNCRLARFAGPIIIHEQETGE